MSESWAIVLLAVRRVVPIALVLTTLASCSSGGFSRSPEPGRTTATGSTTLQPFTPTDTVTPTDVEACVTARSLRVRAGPGTEFAIVGGLASGDCVLADAIDSSGEWLRVETTSGSGAPGGWISAEFVVLKGALESLGKAGPPTPGVAVLASPAATRRPSVASPRPLPTDTRWPTSTRTRAALVSTRWATATSGPSSGGGGGGGGSGTCSSSYVGVCLLVGIGDYDCAGGSGNGPNYVRGPVRVVGSDPFGLDRDGDGWGCE